MQATTATLAETSNLFQLWRDKRNSKFSPIPIHLKDQVRQLLSSHSISQVATTLNISRSVLYNIQKGKNCSFINNNHQTSATDSLNFIPVNFTDIHQIAKNQSTNSPPLLNITCEFVKPNGTKLIIHTSDPTSIIKTFLCSN